MGTVGEPDPASFRDSLGIVSREGKRRWIYPKKPSGTFYRFRTILSLLLLAALFGLPFLTTNGRPFLLLNVLDRKFILFGQVFGPHDYYLLGLGIITLIVFIVLFTVVFGRLFCGWVCPQTVFMEMVFRRIDYWIEGDHRQQERLDAAPWTGAKVLRKGGKHAVSFGAAFLIGNTLLAYVIGVERLADIVTDPPAHHLGGLTAMLVFAGAFYWIFAWFREQACILVCPYGRLQGVLLDRHSVVIGYDHVRGEPRERLRRGEQRTAGDCIDCFQCVEVCPTGIDIRNGTQLECVNCTACIDACDEIMGKIGKPKGLIRYASAESIAAGRGFRVTPRVIGYSAVLFVLVAVLGVLLATRREIDVTLLRTPGMFFQEQPDGRVSNVYDFRVVNKTFAAVPLRLQLQDPAGEVRVIGEGVSVAPQGIVEAKVLVLLDRSALTAMSTPIRLGVYDGDRLVDVVRTTFLGPAGRK